MSKMLRMLNRLAVICFIFIGFNAFSDNVKDNPQPNWHNAEGYIDVISEGKLKHYIVISGNNTVKLLPIEKDPSEVLKNKASLINTINQIGGK